MNPERLLERFLRYVKINTRANELAESYPSSPEQIEFGKMLVGELKELGLEDVSQSEFGIVTAVLPSNLSYDSPVIVFNAHIDTFPDVSGKDVQPQVIRDYAGGDIQLPNASEQVIRVADNPELETLHGATLITTDGTTLLGGDDKAGIAIMNELLQVLVEDPSIPHGTIKFLYTCDEEIGKGVSHVDVPALGATVCYTFDGGGANSVDVQTFSADLAVIKIKGANIHTSIAKDRMVNAIRVASTFISLLPSELSPECTSEEEGFLHPYAFEGGVGEMTLRVILRDFDTEKLDTYKQLLEQLAEQTKSLHPQAEISIEFKKQYRNLGDGLKKEPRSVEYAVHAHKALGRETVLASIRGGTDGSAFTELGLPTPNLSSGQHNPHSLLEWACLDEMSSAVEVGLEIVKRWAQDKTENA